MGRLEPQPHAVTCRAHRRNGLRIPTGATLAIAASLAVLCGLGCGDGTGVLAPPGDAGGPDAATSDGGTSPTPDADAVILPASVGCAKQLASGDDYTCILYDDGRAACLGGGAFGQLGTGATADAPGPVRVEQLPAARLLAAGGHHTCSLGEGGLLCWGDNRSSELGVTGLEQSALPVPVELRGAPWGVVQLALGSRHGCLLDTLVHGYCWGTGALGITLPVAQQIPAIGEAPLEILQLGGSATRVIDAGHLVDVPWRADARVVSPIPGAPDRVIANAIGDDHDCVLKSGGTVWCRGTGYPDFYAVVADFGNDVAEVAVGTDFTCARTDGGQVLCRGRNDSGQLGDGTLAASPLAVTVPGIQPAIELSLGAAHGCARLVDGSVWCWGALGGSAIRGAPERVAGPGPAETCGDVTGVVAPPWSVPIPDGSAADELSDATTAWAQNQCRCGVSDDADLPGCIQEETPLLHGCLAALGAGSEAQALCMARAEWTWAACAAKCAGQGSVSGLDECVASAEPDCGARSGAMAFCLRRRLPCDQTLAVQAQYFQTCDGKMDCPNGFDEANCRPNSTAFHCADGLSSIAIELVMNGRPDCPDGSDEL
jgi:alpha-tubulin suppressor-like RCC1 family protein